MYTLCFNFLHSIILGRIIVVSYFLPLQYDPTSFYLEFLSYFFKNKRFDGDDDDSNDDDDDE